MEIRKCTPADYPELLDVFNDAFNYGRENEWFQKEMSHCTPYPAKATKEEIERHYMCIIGGRIAGGLGAYPMDWVVSNYKKERLTISAYGIGQVCCLPEFRNQGVMSALMKASSADMREHGRTVGYLRGDRRRYAYFGYDFGGCTVKYRMNKKLLELIAKPGTTIRQAKFEDWCVIDDVYKTLPSYVKRSADYWGKMLARTNMQWLIGERDSYKGFICVLEGRTVSEAYGDPGVLAAMLLDRANSLEEGQALNVMHPAENIITTPMGQMLCNAAAQVDSHPTGLLVVTNAAKLLTEMDVEHEKMNDATKESIARQLLNFAPLPEKRPFVQPLCAWVPDADSI